MSGSSDTESKTDETVEHRFSVTGMPRVSVRNVSGETKISVGEASEVYVRAVKRVHGWSEDRARRLLENVEIRFEQQGDDVLIEPRFFEQERSWLDLFRGGRVAVDLDIRVPREAQVDASTVSGELSVAGTRGPTELRSVSGTVEVDDVQGPLRLRSVSGDVKATGYAGRLEANSVSGEVDVERSRIRAHDIVTVSGDVRLASIVPAEEGTEGRVKTVSGDVVLAFVEPDAEIDFRTLSGETNVEVPGRIEKEGRRDRRIVIGDGRLRLRVKTVSGDLSIRDGGHEATDMAAPAEEAIAMSAPRPPAAGPAARDVLDRLARRELSVDDAAAALDAVRRR